MKTHCHCWHVGEECCHCGVSESRGECRADATAPKCRMSCTLSVAAWLPFLIVLLFFGALFAIGGFRQLFGDMP